MEPVEQAIYDTVHNSDLQPKEIASRMGMSYQILINKANANFDQNRFSVLEAVALQIITGTNRINRAMSLQVEASAKEEQPLNILMAALKAASEHGDVIKAVERTIADGRVTGRELEECQVEIDEAIQALKEVSTSLVATYQKNVTRIDP